MGAILKQTINLGAYGWRQEHWLKSFYPEDLPVETDEDWRLTYYSNEFNAVLVPADYWCSGQMNDCEEWLDSVHTDFQFFIECRPYMFDEVSLQELTSQLKKLKPQLAALVFLDEGRAGTDILSDEWKSPFLKLSEFLQLEVIGNDPAASVWHPAQSSANTDEQPRSSHFAFIEDALTDLRLSRTTVEQFAMQLDADVADQAAVIIVSHPALMAGNLSKFRSVIDIMGF